MSAATATFASSANSSTLPEWNPTSALQSRFQVKRHISSGGYGSVYLAVDNKCREYAIKLQKHDPKSAMLKHEITIFQRLYFDPLTRLPPIGIPKLYHYFVKCGHEFLVMERLGDSLRQKLKECPSKTFSKKTGLMIGIQVVRRLQMLHGNHVLHRDIKPSNLVMGLGSAKTTVNIIDFGLSEIIKDWMKYNPNGYHEFAGTYEYASIEALFNERPTRAGDLQSLLYSIIDMVTGKLQWEYTDGLIGRKLTPYELGEQRLATKPAELCVEFPELTNFAKLVFKIKKRDEPNYDRLVEELNTALESIGCINDRVFDWLHEEHHEKDKSRGFQAITGKLEDLLKDCHQDQSIREPQLEDDLLLEAPPMVLTKSGCGENVISDERELDLPDLPSILPGHESYRDEVAVDIQEYFIKGFPDVLI